MSGVRSRQEPISTPASAASVFSASLPTEIGEERFFVLPLDENGKVLADPILVSVGHEDGTAQIDLATVFREALKAGAEEIIVAHNHPSGKLTPSKADLQLTEELRSRAEWLGVGFLDHIILGASNSAKGFDFISLAETQP
jgi:DNA repair protein RadC